MAEKKYMILAVPMSQWSWLEDILDSETGETTGRKIRKYGIFWDFIRDNIDPTIITPKFARLIDENPRIMIKDGEEWGIIILPISRFVISEYDYDVWATAMLSVMTGEGIYFVAGTVLRSEKQQWFSRLFSKYTFNTRNSY